VPLVAVGGVVVDNVPEAVKQFAIDVFGTNDKLALQVGTVVLLCAFAAVLGGAGPAPHLDRRGAASWPSARGYRRRA
jgi:hypothetical protein